MEKPLVSILGCGWLGVGLAQRLVLDGYDVRGSTTTPAKLSGLTSMGIDAVLLRIEPEAEGETLSSGAHDRLFETPTLILNTPPMTAFGPDYHPAQIRAILHKCTSMAKGLKHLVYVSSTSVYGSHQGDVSEDTLPLPDEGSGPILLEAEAFLASQAVRHGFGLTILRPGGLVGPGRHPGLFLSGKENVRDPESPINLVHQLDLIDCLALIIEKPARAGEVRVYNAVAKFHPARREFYGRAAAAIGVAGPTFAAVNSDAATKRVSSEKIRTELGVEFKCDNLLEALGERRL